MKPAKKTKHILPRRRLQKLSDFSARTRANPIAHAEIIVDPGGRYYPVAQANRMLWGLWVMDTGARATGLVSLDALDRAYQNGTARHNNEFTARPLSEIGRGVK